VHLGLGHGNSFSPLFLAAPAPGTTWQHRSPGLTPARAVTPAAGPGRLTQPNAQNTSLVNK
jgi:hypothetical protein